MPRPKVTSQMTTGQVVRRLGIGRSQLMNWVQCGVFPPPSFIDNNGVRYFDREWLRKAKEILEDKGVLTEVNPS